MRRVACVALPEVRLEVAAEADGTSPATGGSADVLPARRPLPERGRNKDGRCPSFAVVIARPGGAVQGERDVLGNTRLDVVSLEARRLGVRPGQTVAAARAKCAELRVRVLAESAVQTALARVAEVALAFGPTVAFDVAHDVVWVEIGGCAHLHGGEGELARALEERVHDLGHACRVVVASGPRVASAVARHAPARHKSPLVVPEGKHAAAMGELPVAALALDDDTSRWLRDLGLSTCGDLQRLPRRAFGTRLGARAHDVMQLLDGMDDAPLDAWRPPEVPEERVELDWGASTTEALVFVVKTLCDRLAARLHGRAMSAASLELCLTLDRALCHGFSSVSTCVVALPAPLACATDLCSVLRARLEHTTLAAPVLAVTLRATALARASARNLDLLVPEPKADRALPRLVAEIGAELGPACIGTLALVDTWSPERRTSLVPFGRPHERTPHRALVTSALEPSRVTRPVPIELDELVNPRTLMRIEAAQWWRSGGGPRDLAAAWVDSPRTSGHAWVELRREGALLRGWFD